MNKKWTKLGMLLSLSIVLSIIEGMIPIFGGMIPGIKLGFANIIILLVLYLYSAKEAFYISISRVVIVGILRTGLFGTTFLFSLSGAVISIIPMILLKKTNQFTVVGISAVGAIFHSVGQILIAILFLGNTTILYYLPFMLLISIPAGIVTGFITKSILKELVGDKYEYKKTN